MARVMIVDDSPTDVQNLRSLLVKAGHTVTEATSGQDALDRIKQDNPEVVIMDVVMPGVNGFQATRQLAKDLVKPVKEAELLEKLKLALGS